MQTDVLSNGILEVEYLVQGGLRVMGVRLLEDGRNLFIRLPDLGWETKHGLFRLLGGHRLWHAPERANRSDFPEAEEVFVERLGEQWVRLGQAVEMPTGIRKEMEIRLLPGKAQVEVTHRLFNKGAWAVELAPWAITQLQPGGVVLLPQPPLNEDLLPNRALVLWPYTEISDERLSLGKDFWRIWVKPGFSPLKIGQYNSLGWVGYWLDGLWFEKRFCVEPATEYVDWGANVEVYCNDRFVELETQGRFQCVQPDDFVEHTEVWSLSQSAVQDESELLVWLSGRDE